MKSLLTIALSLFCTMSYAGDLTYIPAVHHFKKLNAGGAEWNSDTRGLKLTLDNGFTIGTMKNSYFRQSSFAGYTYRPLEIGSVSVGVMAGLVSGYTKQEMATKIPLMIVGTIKWKVTEKYNVELMAVPTVKGNSGFVAIGFGVAF